MYFPQEFKDNRIANLERRLESEQIECEQVKDSQCYLRQRLENEDAAWRKLASELRDRIAHLEKENANLGRRCRIAWYPLLQERIAQLEEENANLKQDMQDIQYAIEDQENPVFLGPI